LTNFFTYSFTVNASMQEFLLSLHGKKLFARMFKRLSERAGHLTLAVM